MTDSNGVQWFCHRCARKDDLALDTDPVMLRVCDGCQVENWTRPLMGPVIEAKVEERVQEEIEKAFTEEAIEEPEPVNPYEGKTKEELVALLKEKE